MLAIHCIMLAALHYTHCTALCSLHCIMPRCTALCLAALHYASLHCITITALLQADDLDCVKALISLDADVNLEDSMGKTPLDFASIKGKLVYTPNKGIQLAMLNHGVATMKESFTGRSYRGRYLWTQWRGDIVI